jgi:hypothetical protein
VCVLATPVGHSFAYVAGLRFFRDVWIKTQSAAVGSGCATYIATHPLREESILPTLSISGGACLRLFLREVDLF